MGCSNTKQFDNNYNNILTHTNDEFHLNIISFQYSEQELVNEVKPLINNNILKLKHGINSLSAYSNDIDVGQDIIVTYVYQTDIFKYSIYLKKKLSIHSPNDSILIIKSCKYGNKDVTSMIKELLLYETSLAISDNIFSNEKQLFTIEYMFMSSIYKKTFKSSSTIYIPSHFESQLIPLDDIIYKSVSTDSISIRLSYDESSIFSNLEDTNNCNQSNVISSRKDSLCYSLTSTATPVLSANVSFRLSNPTTMNSNNNTMTLPDIMKGYINIEGKNGKVWHNRYFVLNSFEYIGLLAYYNKPLDRFPYGKDLKGEISLVDYDLDVDNDILLLRYTPNDKGDHFKLEIKDETYRKKWIKAISDHILYAKHYQEEYEFN